MSFTAAHPGLLRTLTARGFVTPMPVQAAILAPEVADRDVLVSAQTGSGKTVAFGLALARTLLGDAERFTAPGAPRALIVAPTRELALQVHRELTWLYAETGARIASCVGGMDPRREIQALGHGVHIVVGTPGRLCDHLGRGALVLDRLAAVVLDEADEMLDMGFREDLERLLDAAPDDRRTLMFSATIPAPIAALARRYQRDALRIATSGDGGRHRDIDYHVVSIVPRERDLAVVNLLRFHDPPGALVFCGTRDRVTHLAANLSERGFSVVALSGELSQRERNQALQALRDGRARVCVATDVAARGLDLPDLGLVIHADLPQNKEILVHRSGRTGRAGKRGLAIVIAIDAARRFIERLLASARIEATWQLPPSSDDIRSRDQDHLGREIRALTDEVSDADRSVARSLLAEQSPEELVAALVRMRREARPAPEELTMPRSMQPRPSFHQAGDHRPRYDHARRVPQHGGEPEPRADGARPPYGKRSQALRAGQLDRSPAGPGRSEHAPRAGQQERSDVPAESGRAEHLSRAGQLDGSPAGPGRSGHAPRAELQERSDAPAESGRAEHLPRAGQLDRSPAGPGRGKKVPHADQPDRSDPGRSEHAPRAGQLDRAHSARPASGRGEHAHAPARSRSAGPVPAEPAITVVDGSEHVAGSAGSEPSMPPDRLTRAPWPIAGGRSLVWFTINIGRSKNADPKWLIPLLCRRGGISKNAIGKIQILARETRVEISHDVSERFAAAVREPDSKDRNIHIEPLDAAM